MKIIKWHLNLWETLPALTVYTYRVCKSKFTLNPIEHELENTKISESLSKDIIEKSRSKIYFHAFKSIELIGYLILYLNWKINWPQTKILQ